MVVLLHGMLLSYTPANARRARSISRTSHIRDFANTVNNTIRRPDAIKYVRRPDIQMEPEALGVCDPPVAYTTPQQGPSLSQQIDIESGRGELGRWQGLQPAPGPPVPTRPSHDIALMLCTHVIHADGRHTIMTRRPAQAGWLVCKSPLGHQFDQVNMQVRGFQVPSIGAEIGF